MEKSLKRGLIMAETVPKMLHLLVTLRLKPLFSQDTGGCASTLQEDTSPRATVLTLEGQRRRSTLLLGCRAEK